MNMHRGSIAVAALLAAGAFQMAGGRDINPGLERNEPPKRGVPVLKYPEPSEDRPGNRASRRRAEKLKRKNRA